MPAYSYAQFVGNGTNTLFTFGFPYLDRSHISVKVNGTTKSFTWVADGSINITPAPTGTVEIRRTTPKDTPPVDFSDGSVLKESDLDLMVRFLLYTAQEAADNTADALAQSSLGSALYQVYQGAKEIPPTARNDGTDLQIGDMYFNTVQSAMKVYGSLGWQDAGTTLAGVVTQPPGGTPVIASAGQTVVPVPEGYIPNQGIVFLNGVSVAEPDVSTLDGNNIVFASPLNALDEVDYIFFPSFGVGTGGGGGGGATVASNVAYTPLAPLVATNVQTAINELLGRVPLASDDLPSPPGLYPSAGTSTKYARADHVHLDTGGGGGGGGTGAPGYSQGVAYAYQRSATPLTSNPGAVTWDFTTGKINSPPTDALANGWTKTIPAGSDPLYVTVASASSQAGTDTIAASEWSAPVVLAKDGNSGLNVATIYIYKRAVTPAPPALPTAACTYQFNPPILSGLNNGWSTTIPSDSAGQYLYVSTATAAGTGTTDTINASEWAAVQLMAKNGADGANGTNGTNGTNGSNGANGARGTVTIAYAIGGASWSDSTAASAIASAGYGAPQERDVVTLYNTGSNFSSTKFYSGGVWNTLTAYINGNMLVTGTLSADVISGGTLNGVKMNVGSGHTPSGKALEITSTGVLWTDNVFGGTASFNNNYYAIDAVRGATYSGVGGGYCGVLGSVDSSNSNSGAKGVQGTNYYSNKTGYLGTATHAVYAGVGGYGPFTGAHDCILEEDFVGSVGDILIDNVKVGEGVGISDTIFTVKLSNAPYQKGSTGVLENNFGLLIHARPAAMIHSSPDSPGEDTIMSPYYEANKERVRYGVMNALGEGKINVCGEGGNIEKGDLIVTSSIPGKGMKQSDDIYRSCTVARAREDVTFSSPSEVKQIACVYLCG